MLSMQLALGFSAGFAKKAFMMSFGQVPILESRTPWPTPGNRKTYAFESVWAANIPLTGGVTGSYSPCKISVGMLLLTGSFWIAGTGFMPQN